MTVVRSAMGTRLDCDGCDEFAATPSLSIEVLRRATGYTHHDGRDYCEACRARLAPFGTPPDDDDGPAAA